MQVTIGGTRVRLGDADLIGVGGEARVYRVGGRAAKIFHRPDPGAPPAERARAERLLALKRDKLARFPRGLPAEVLAPEERITDARGQVIGYTMPLVERAEDLGRLGQRRWREGVVSAAEVVALFRGLWLTLDALHRKGVVVGDLNDGNVLFRLPAPCVVIDVDSMQFGGLPCAVGHERFLDPGLYGADLLAGPAFSPDTDWYAFATLLFASLLYVHPYGGVHPAHPTLLRRAEARWSVLRPDVVYPKAALPYRILPDPLLEHFEKVYDGGLRGGFPALLLERLRFARCACGLEHARDRCPACAIAVAREAVVHHGRCRALRVFATRGRILRAVLQGGLRYLYEEDGVVRREEQARVLCAPVRPGMRFAIAGPSTWVGLGPDLCRVQAEQVVERATAAAFDASSATCWRVEHGWLIDGARGTRVGQVLPGLTWLACGERLGFGYYRAGEVTVFFLWQAGAAGLREVRLPPLEGRVVAADAVFDERHVAFSVTTEKEGRRHAALTLLDERGAVLGRLEGPPESSPLLRGGKALAGGRLLVATDDGLCAARVEGGRVVPGVLFADTAPFVGEETDLLPGPAGSVYVVTTRSIIQLTLS